MDNLWVVAVSGGPDSMALLDIMLKNNYQCVVAHVNYHKRKTSDRDEKIVIDFCEQNNVKYFIDHAENIEKKGNFQTIAREHRYSFFKTIVNLVNAKGVVVAHHKDDDIETYIFQKNRNSESENLGLSEHSIIKNVHVWRPLLSYLKEDLVQYCKKNNIHYGIDETNLMGIYERNRIRLSLGNFSKEEFKELEDKISQEKIKHKEKIDKIKKHISNYPNEILTTEVKSTLELRYWLAYNNVNVYSISNAHLKSMYDSFKKNRGYFELGEKHVYAQYGKIYVHEVNETFYVLDKLEYGEYGNFIIEKFGKQIEGFDLFDSDYPITIRNPRPGDYIQLRIGKKSISRFFIDRKIPKACRKSWLVIENCNKEIVFVVGIGSDIRHYSNNSKYFMIKL